MPLLLLQGARILGTSPVDIDRAEDRNKFSTLLDALQVDQPAWRELTSVEDALSFASSVGYPVLVRPSYVLSGAAMCVASGPEQLRASLLAAAVVSSGERCDECAAELGVVRACVRGDSANVYPRHMRRVSM